VCVCVCVCVLGCLGFHLFMVAMPIVLGVFLMLETCAILVRIYLTLCLSVGDQCPKSIFFFFWVKIMASIEDKTFIS
jgi:hypothetical protein